MLKAVDMKLSIAAILEAKEGTYIKEIEPHLQTCISDRADRGKGVAQPEREEGNKAAQRSS